MATVCARVAFSELQHVFAARLADYCADVHKATQSVVQNWFIEKNLEKEEKENT
jgi:hypothetical protein